MMFKQLTQQELKEHFDAQLRMIDSAYDQRFKLEVIDERQEDGVQVLHVAFRDRKTDQIVPDPTHEIERERAA